MATKGAKGHKAADARHQTTAGRGWTKEEGRGEQKIRLSERGVTEDDGGRTRRGIAEKAAFLT
jgi:hypothetical protein